jgi:hypothetical protein
MLLVHAGRGSMKKLIVLAALALVFVAGTATVLTMRPSPAMACVDGGCWPLTEGIAMKKTAAVAADRSQAIAMKKIFALAILAVALIGGTAIVLAIQPSPAVPDCSSGSCWAGFRWRAARPVLSVRS